MNQPIDIEDIDLDETVVMVGGERLTNERADQMADEVLRLVHGRFRVEWSEDDKEYVGLAEGFPSLSWLAATEDDALIGIMKLVRDIDSEKA